MKTSFTSKCSNHKTILSLRIRVGYLPHFNQNQDNLEAVAHRMVYCILLHADTESFAFALSKITLCFLYWWLGMFLQASHSKLQRALMENSPELPISWRLAFKTLRLYHLLSFYRRIILNDLSLYACNVVSDGIS